MANAAMPGPGGTGQLEPQAVQILVQLLNVLRRNGPQAWPQLFQMAVRAGIPQDILPPPNAPPNVIAQFAKKLVMFLRAYRTGAQRPQQGGVQGMQYGGPVLDVTATPAQPAMAMAYGGPVLDVTAAPDRPAMAMAYGGRVDSIHAMMRPGEYVATPEAIALDPTLDDRISAANRASAGGMEGPIMLAGGPTTGTQKHWIDQKLFGPGEAPAPQPERRYNTTRDVKADADAQKMPPNDQVKRHTQKALEEGRRNQKKHK